MQGQDGGRAEGGCSAARCGSQARHGRLSESLFSHCVRIRVYVQQPTADLHAPLLVYGAVSLHGMWEHVFHQLRLRHVVLYICVFGGLYVCCCCSVCANFALLDLSVGVD